jgi:hypothetical protein
VTYRLCFQGLEKTPYIYEVCFGSGERKGLGRLRRFPEGKGVELAAEPHCGHQAVAALAAAVSCLRAAFISDRGAPSRLFSFGASHGLPYVTGRHSARAAGHSQNKLNRAQYSGISTKEDYKPVMQRWSSQRQRYRPCPDAPGWPAISSCSPGARQPFLRPPFRRSFKLLSVRACFDVHRVTRGRVQVLLDPEIPLCGADLRMPVSERDLLNFLRRWRVPVGRRCAEGRAARAC